jgi:hypothetical protein
MQKKWISFVAVVLEVVVGVQVQLVATPGATSVCSRWRVVMVL